METAESGGLYSNWRERWGRLNAASGGVRRSRAAPAASSSIGILQQRQEEVEQAVNLTESVVDVSQQQIRQSAATAQQALMNTDETKQIILQEKEEHQVALEYVHKAGMRLQDTVEKISADLTIGKGQYERIKEKMVELQLKQKELQEKTDMAEEMKNHMRSV